MEVAEPIDDTLDLWLQVVDVAREHGLAHVGVAPADVMTRARRVLHERAAAGLHDTMQFTYRNPDRSTDPGRAVPGATSIVVAAVPYLLDEPERPCDDSGRQVPAARVARYAWVDHYGELRRGLRAVAAFLRAGGHRAVVFADDNALVDREAAWLAGLGWFGKNANLLVPGAGSWFVLGSVVTTAWLPRSSPVPDGCGACHRCIDACPTAAIVSPGVIDARRCLAWLLQRPGIMPRPWRVAMGDRIYGCDDCQDVCPPTIRFGPSRRATAPTADAPEVQAWVPVLELLRAHDEAVLKRYGRWYLHRREPRWLRRNALVVLGNVGRGDHPETIDVLRAHLRPEVDPMLQAHAVWAAARLGRRDLLEALASATSVHPDVADELAHLDDVPLLTGVS